MRVAIVADPPVPHYHKNRSCWSSCCVVSQLHCDGKRGCNGGGFGLRTTEGRKRHVCYWWSDSHRFDVIEQQARTRTSNRSHSVRGSHVKPAL